MLRKKDRLKIVFDTNLILRRFIRDYPQSANRRVFDLWRQSELQLIVSQPIIDEYLEMLEIVGKLNYRQLIKFRAVLDKPNVTKVNLGKRFNLSKDPDDNVFLDAAYGGRADFIISNDNDLLLIPPAELKQNNLQFEILTPSQFLARLGQ